MAWKLPLPAFTKRAPEPDLPGVMPAWLPRMADMVSWLLIASLMYFLWLWTLEISGDRAIPLKVGEAGVWTFNANFYWPLLIGFTMSAIGLPMLAKIGIPIYCELSFKKQGQKWPKVWMLILIVLTSFVLIAGNLHVINGARLEKNRDGAVKEELTDQNRAALKANLDSVSQDLQDITNPALTTYQAQASREGAAAWAKRVATAKAQNDWQADAIERALAAAERGDRLRADRKAAIQALAMAPTKAAAADRIVTKGDWATSITDELDKARALMLSIVQDLAALLMGWIAYRLYEVRKHQLAAYEASQLNEEIAGDALAIEDKSGETQFHPQEEMYDEQGRRLVKAKRKKEEWWVAVPDAKPRKPKAKKDPREAQAAPDLPAEALAEAGMFDDIPDAGQTSGDDRSADDVDARLYVPSETEKHDDEDASAPETGASDDPRAANGAGLAGQPEGGVPEPELFSEELTHEAPEDQQADEPEEAAGESEGESSVLEWSGNADGSADGYTSLGGAELDDQAYEAAIPVLVDEVHDQNIRVLIDEEAVGERGLNDQEALPDGTADSLWPEISETESGQFEFEGETISEAEALELEAEHQRLTHPRLPAPEAAE